MTVGWTDLYESAIWSMQEKVTPAMRHGMDAFTKGKGGSIDPPDIYRMLYRPWLFMGTKFGARFEQSRANRSGMIKDDQNR